MAGKAQVSQSRHVEWLHQLFSWDVIFSLSFPNSYGFLLVFPVFHRGTWPVLHPVWARRHRVLVLDWQLLNVIKSLYQIQHVALRLRPGERNVNNHGFEMFNHHIWAWCPCVQLFFWPCGISPFGPNCWTNCLLNLSLPLANWKSGHFTEAPNLSKLNSGVSLITGGKTPPPHGMWLIQTED